MSPVSNTRTQMGPLLLLSTASGGVVASVRLLLAAGAYVNLRDNNGNDTEGMFIQIYRLLNTLSDPIKLDIIFLHDGRHLLYWAARNNHSDVVKVLLEAGADPNIENWNYGDDALGWAAYNGEDTMLRSLANAGEVDHHPIKMVSLNHASNTAFLLAVKHNHLDIARILFNHGAYINAQNNEG
ncbi:putative ankyrin repeat protein PA3287 [Penaeus japonicus]|uniref:putative ankyrin repeat protein PA3287 n=1 Tax=Penaeus japonicus TaxID=27405 RepID=UPI001C712BB2|nr:putative ankyrin repeat protein PA3287 [Penaeus japonicus]XP_042864399.1 putative ankyrin repeat protein PA3287 [Penaeus japonicus]XP_042864404.1 putative ankyrin repeat protein PA3287 [Penaeus japonicus]